MDIKYLLFLQHLREMTGGIFDQFFDDISKIAIGVLVFLPYVIYWSVDKKWGNRFFAVYFGTDIINLCLKLTVCAYRPWIRSDAIHPAGDSKVDATSYSFPSGHTECVTSLLGPVAYWQWSVRRWLSILCIISIALVGFSRNFLGVHTPQDVIVGFAEAVLILFIVAKLYPKVDGNDKAADLFCLAGVLFSFAFLAYIQLKPYPMDYVDGKLLVDPKEMMSDGFRACGGFLAFCIGNFIDRHFIHYKVPAGHKNLPLLVAVGLGLLFSWRTYFGSSMITLFGSHWGLFMSSFVMAFLGIVVVPVIIKLMTYKDGKNHAS